MLLETMGQPGRVTYVYTSVLDLEHPDRDSVCGYGVTKHRAYQHAEERMHVAEIFATVLRKQLDTPRKTLSRGAYQRMVVSVSIQNVSLKCRTRTLLTRRDDNTSRESWHAGTTRQ